MTSVSELLTDQVSELLIDQTHDLGGFMVDDEPCKHEGNCGGDTPANRARRDPELLLRWLQFGAVSPLFRTHCSHCEIRPWLYPNFDLLKPVYQFRSMIQPYVYSAQAR
jgi:alpha-glucosidase (family GH31 glycosyl hydrolase)